MCVRVSVRSHSATDHSMSVGIICIKCGDSLILTRSVYSCGRGCSCRCAQLYLSFEYLKCLVYRAARRTKRVTAAKCPMGVGACVRSHSARDHSMSVGIIGIKCGYSLILTRSVYSGSCG